MRKAYIANFDKAFFDSLPLGYNLSFFAPDDGGGEKTEQPTTRKRQKAREEGQVARSQELGTAALFLSAFFALRTFGGWIYTGVANMFGYSLIGLGDLSDTMGTDFMRNYLTYFLSRTLLIASPVLAVCMTAGLVVNFMQVRWAPTTKPLKPKFSKLNPINGVKRLFSFNQLLELPKSLLKMAIIGIMCYFVIVRELPTIVSYIEMEVFSALVYTGGIAVDIGLRIGLLYLFLALADYPYQRYRHTKGLKMSKHEVKEEHKSIEGNPLVKSKIKQKMRQASLRRMMQEVPGADVIITNPQHYAVAVKYDRLKASAPIVVAKGVDYAAKRIREKAMEFDVFIVENKPLARALYNTVDIGREIPADLYQAVAEILAYVYRLREKGQA